MEDKDSPVASWSAQRVFALAATAVGALWLLTWIAIGLIWDELKPSGVGDSINVLTSLFTGLALAAVAVSIHFQRRDLKATLDEMEAGRELQEGRAETQVKQLHIDRLNGLLSSAAAEVGLWREMQAGESDASQRSEISSRLKGAVDRMRVYRRMLVDDRVRRERDVAIDEFESKSTDSEWD